jgi:putative PIN family toxin of toxin-antitoxin system
MRAVLERGRIRNVPSLSGSEILHVISFQKSVRLVLDTDVMVAAMRSNQGASRQLLLAAMDRRVTVVASVPLLLEYEAVLTRAEHLHVMGISAAEVNEVLDGLCAVVEPVAFRFLWRPQLKDPGDEMVLETAVNGSADRLATFNVRHFDPVGRRFGIRAMRPGAILRELRGARHEKK